MFKAITRTFEHIETVMTANLRGHLKKALTLGIVPLLQPPPSGDLDELIFKKLHPPRLLSTAAPTACRALLSREQFLGKARQA